MRENVQIRSSEVASDGHFGKHKPVQLNEITLRLHRSVVGNGWGESHHTDHDLWFRVGETPFVGVPSTGASNGYTSGNRNAVLAGTMGRRFRSTLPTSDVGPKMLSPQD